MNQDAGGMQTFSLLKSLKGNLILNLIQAKQQPQKWSYREKSYSTTQFLFIDKEIDSFLSAHFHNQSWNHTKLYSWIQGRLIHFVLTRLRKLSLGQKLFIYVWHTKMLCSQNWTQLCILWLIIMLVFWFFSHWELKEAGGNSFQSKSSETQVTWCPAFHAGSVG